MMYLSFQGLNRTDKKWYLSCGDTNQDTCLMQMVLIHTFKNELHPYICLNYICLKRIWILTWSPVHYCGVNTVKLTDTFQSLLCLKIKSQSEKKDRETHEIDWLNINISCNYFCKI